ncbi:carboxypeptidase-like regulatory domain-containing protein [Flavitalea sp. BT771]|uniref:carboxypeptidase-like regulatory domain-containing protein n=1 Tax=Flavitalea sp. BT771 TaxID=3063329 RepID=UPI0026E397A1|nr:carboxypeptidase-like regulatory domain-containing protein [Flavitalea sp. BT771]MDO6434271.1 carboxypeptidase-like regulatory domain-containing protein [Flavitalea sp. BT771]MDV6223171.1 carboxypeptidase-like regulatory domain-containing protein [Flavitalea sp. BT771]
MNAHFLRPLLYSALILLSLPLYSQDKTFSITGKVIDAKSGQALAGASVFCQNTTIGTVSKNDGSFSMRLANGGYDMIVSFTGYETRNIRINKDTKDKDSLTIEMKEADKSLGEAVVTGSAEVEDGWNKYGQFFLDNFIGTTPFASQCTLENKDALKFYFYKKRNKLRVKAKEELIVTNNALGYKIRFQLDSFVYEYGTNISTYAGYPLFEEMQGTPEQQQTWKNNRDYTYAGSRLHFIRSWYDSTLADEGFILEWADSSNKGKLKTIKDPYDPKFYSVDSGEVAINLTGRLRVSYTNQVPNRKYLQEHNFPLNTKVEISALDLLNGFVIEENGYFYDQPDVINMGYWAWKKLAETLPYDYNPE